MTSPTIPHDPYRRFFGRRKGPALSPRKQALLAQLYPQVRIDPKRLAADPAGLFDRQVDALWLEIGFGKGEHLAWQAKQNPTIGLIGCEPYLNGMVAMLDLVGQQALTNIRLYGDDARDILEALPEACLDRVFLLHPDPWPKRRHAARRFINHPNLDLIARVLKPGGLFRASTDDPVYRQWTALKMLQRKDFIWTARSKHDWLTQPDDLPTTRYANKAVREGRYDVYFDFERTV